MNGQHWAARLAHNLVGPASQDHAADRRPGAAGQHDHVGSPCGRLLGDCRGDLSASCIHSFLLEYQINPAWQKFPLDSSLLITAILIQHLYTSFYDFLVSDESGHDPIGVVLDYAVVRAKASTPPPSDHPWWAVARRTFQEHGMPPPDRSPGTGPKVMEDVERLERLLPEGFSTLARSTEFVALLRSIGDKETRQALRAQLISRPLASEPADSEPPAHDGQDPEVLAAEGAARASSAAN